MGGIFYKYGGIVDVKNHGLISKEIEKNEILNKTFKTNQYSGFKFPKNDPIILFYLL